MITLELDIMSSKELGQIHSVNFLNTVDSSSLSSNRYKNLDVPLELTKQLQTMVRQGNFFKVVGIDMTLTTDGTEGGGQISGYVRYYAPTKGRCAAYRSAFDAMRNAMKMQGINFRDNAQYDFRVGFNGEGRILGQDSTILNQATLDSTSPLDLYNPSDRSVSVFDVHNEGVQAVTDPSLTGSLFGAGFNTLGVQSTPTDFVLNDGLMYTGNSDTASTQWENIPFMLSWTPDTTDIAVQWNWRPAPALYLAVMTGQLQLYIEEVNLDGDADGVEINTAVMVAGWKSIMGDPSKKKKRSSRGRRRKSKK